MRCRKARWFLCARCDGTLSERQRNRLESHLASCEGCRREAFYFSEVGTLATRLETQAVRPDFNLRLRASIRRAEAEAVNRPAWVARFGVFVLRPAAVAVATLVLGAAGIGAYSFMTNSETPTASIGGGSVNPEYGLSVIPLQQSLPPGALTPIEGLDPDASRLRDLYLQDRNLPHDYVVETVRLDDSNGARYSPRYLMPTVTQEQVGRRTSY